MISDSVAVSKIARFSGSVSSASDKKESKLISNSVAVSKMSKFSDSVVSAVNNNSSSAVNVNNSSNLLLLVASFSGLG